MLDNAKTVRDLFDLKEGQEEVTIYWNLTGSQGISNTDGYFNINADESIEYLISDLTLEIHDHVGSEYQESGYVDYDYDEDDDEYDEDEWADADQEGYNEALMDCGEMQFDIFDRENVARIEDFVPFHYVLSTVFASDVNDIEVNPSYEDYLKERK